MDLQIKKNNHFDTVDFRFYFIDGGRKTIFISSLWAGLLFDDKSRDLRASFVINYARFELNGEKRSLLLTVEFMYAFYVVSNVEYFNALYF